MNNRQERLLKEIVESYIATAKPVGSKSLCQKLKCSSATIRNEMAHLEELGYLEKNHISSGRIPSENGYKYYVANLMQPKELSDKDARKLQTIFRNHELALSDAIEACVEIISEMTNYTSIVLGKNSNENTLQQVSVIPLKEGHLVAIVCTDKGIVQNKQFTLPTTIHMQEVVKTCEIINKLLIGTPINEVSERLEYDIKPSGSFDRHGSDTVDVFFSANGANNKEPLAMVASGGEMSRIALAVKSLMSEYSDMPTMIFDEIDTGVSGRAADKMGQLIGRLGKNMQVFAITHLPQIASKGHAHYLVYKTYSEDGTAESNIKRLSGQERVREIARMLSGSEVTKAAMENAAELLDEK